MRHCLVLFLCLSRTLRKKLTGKSQGCIHSLQVLKKVNHHELHTRKFPNAGALAACSLLITRAPRAVGNGQIQSFPSAYCAPMASVAPCLRGTAVTLSLRSHLSLLKLGTISHMSDPRVIPTAHCFRNNPWRSCCQVVRGSANTTELVDQQRVPNSPELSGVHNAFLGKLDHVLRTPLASLVRPWGSVPAAAHLNCVAARNVKRINVVVQVAVPTAFHLDDQHSTIQRTIH